MTTARTLKRLIASSVLYMVVGLAAALVALAANLPAEFAGLSTGKPVSQDFLYGMGTALSPPLYGLFIQAVLTWLVPRPDCWGLFGWIMTFGILLPDSLPGFLLVILFSTPWSFLLGRWMKRLTLTPTEAS